jgi:general secretion pathway protein D
MQWIPLWSWALISLASSTLCAAEPASAPRPAARVQFQPDQKRLTREDVDLMLRQARSAIQEGKFEEAEKILVRAENAHVHYSIFHFGATPSGVRRELNRARRSRPAADSTAAADETGAMADPFLARSGQARPNESSSAALQAPMASTPSREFGEALAQASPAADPVGTSTDAVKNPFTQPAETGAAAARYEAVESAGAVARASWDQGARTGDRRGGTPSLLGGEPGGDAHWELPNAPRPASGEKSAAGPNLLGLSPPQHAPAETTPAMSTVGGEPQGKQQVLAQLAEARQALEAGNVEQAEKLSRAAASLGVPESQFLPDEDRPSLLAWDIERAKHKQGRSTSQVTRLPSAIASPSPNATPMAAVPTPEAPLPMPLAEVPLPLRMANVEELPLPGAKAAPGADAASAAPSLIDTADNSQQVLAKQLSAEVGKRQSEAQKLRSEDPERALAILREAQQLVNESKLPESSRRELLGRIDITLEKTNKYIKDNAAQIELDRRNAEVLETRDREKELKLKLQQKIADLVEEFNRLRDEQRYAEAEIVARRLYELAPDDPVAEQVHQTAKFIRREMLNRQLADSREEGIWDAMNDVEQSSVSNVGDGRELVFDQKHWDQFVKDRKGSKERIERRTERELEIERRLRTPVMLRYDDTPLSEVMDGLSQLAGINIHLDPRGLNQEGVNSDTPVTLNLNKEISLESALNLILEQFHLSYVIKDDVLKITSEQLRDGELVTVTYNVSDLVIPIPNFVPSSGIGLQGLINDAHAAAGYGQNALGAAGPTVLVGGRSGDTDAAATDHVLAQQFNAAPAGGLSQGTVPIGSGPGGMGGGANADFDSLIDLIVSTVSTETWAENGGGEAEIRPFPTNLSLVISQTQAVHEEIADLLEQLRRLQDLQVTIEVRFIQLNDTFFERIGIDFDMNIEDRTVGAGDLTPGSVFEPPGRTSQTVGLIGGDPFPSFTSDLDIPFRQGSFASALPPPFAGFDPSSAANFGFAILSDIEAYFLIQAAQGDTRTNILQAPKVTLFNGQQAFVADAIQRPFVVGVIPVVGEFAAAQQPVIVVLNEGTMMTIQAVVSDDRRYVRMTIVPFFTHIGDVDEFTFEGSTSSTSSSSSKDSDEDGKKEEDSKDDSTVRSGVTVQLPSFQFVSVVTTVSVPDGGTVLLGGIKRLSEGRNEFGVPLLSKVPYINRLFRNVAIGRETNSLMMMVTPRIIIQEEEEERLGIAVP